ncbi:hypothetical protein FPOAC1_006482 [Fusarium poae]|uniref:hypothetical protein n=1 Tax=Fusarium poae TaxID=36050 RepID=UPI001CEA439E|nr:hypothetical protein FPOAC1_006482 [Fusarium poae]KAG8673176.1 hypothetical protein FPOAC1_006482 [Fusarium poae]
MSASTTTSSQGSTANITKICQNGDVILAVGPKAKIQVTSDFLKHISPVFKTMLEGPMSEGEALRNKSPDSPTTISLPADNALAMKRLLRILYGADDLALDFEAVYDIIVLADKYAMAKRLKAFGLDWVRMNLDDECTSAAQFRESWEKMVLSYMLHNDVAFFEVSCYLSQATEGVVTWALELPDQALGLRLAVAIYELYEHNFVAETRMGLCLDCFKNAKDSFVGMQSGCPPLAYDKGSKAVTSFAPPSTIGSTSIRQWSKKKLAQQKRRPRIESAPLGLIQPLKQEADQPLAKNPVQQVVEVLIPGGDLILAVGPERRLFGVSSSFICEISPVFAVMFGPNFEEGHRLRSTQPEDSEMVLELPDDNAQAFCNTLRVLYGADPATADFEPAEIHKITIVVDKYDMVSRFTFASAYWFTKYSWTDDPEETWQLTTAAYWMQNPDAFFNFSKKLIKQLQTSHLSYVDNMPDKMLGLRLCLAIEEQRVHKLMHCTKAKGLCLHCFSRSKVAFTLRIQGCKHRKYHS